MCVRQSHPSSLKRLGHVSVGTAMCANGLFAAAAESGNFVIWDLEERKITFQTSMKNIFQFILHTGDTMV